MNKRNLKRLGSTYDFNKKGNIKMSNCTIEMKDIFKV
jgi:hypothetical protein